MLAGKACRCCMDQLIPLRFSFYKLQYRETDWCTFNLLLAGGVVGLPSLERRGWVGWWDFARLLGEYQMDIHRWDGRVWISIP